MGLTTALGIVGAYGAKKLLTPPKMPTMPEPTVMPTTNDEQVKAAKRRQIAEMQARSGRASTMLSDPGARLGG